MIQNNTRQPIIFGTRFQPSAENHGHALIFSDPGAEKTSRLIKPNLLQKNGSYIIIDKGEGLLEETGMFFEQNGYTIKVLNPDVDTKHTIKFDPFRYIETLEDASMMAMSIVHSMRHCFNTDRQWEMIEASYLTALIIYVRDHCSENTSRFGRLLELVNRSGQSIDIMFRSAGKMDPEDRSFQMYQWFKDMYPADLMNEVKMSLSMTLSAIDTPYIRRLTGKDEIEPQKFRVEPNILYIELSAISNVSFMIANIFMTLVPKALTKYDGLSTTVFFDNIQDVEEIQELDKILSVCDKHGISFIMFANSWNDIISMYGDRAPVLKNRFTYTVFFGYVPAHEDYIHLFVRKQHEPFRKKDVVVVFADGRYIIDEKYSPNKHPEYRKLGNIKTQNNLYYYKRNTKKQYK